MCITIVIRFIPFERPPVFCILELYCHEIQRKRPVGARRRDDGGAREFRRLRACPRDRMEGCGGLQRLCEKPHPRERLQPRWDRCQHLSRTGYLLLSRAVLHDVRHRDAVRDLRCAGHTSAPLRTFRIHYLPNGEVVQRMVACTSRRNCRLRTPDLRVLHGRDRSGNVVYVLHRRHFLHLCTHHARSGTCTVVLVFRTRPRLRLSVLSTISVRSLSSLHYFLLRMLFPLHKNTPAAHDQERCYSSRHIRSHPAFIRILYLREHRRVRRHRRASERDAVLPRGTRRIELRRDHAVPARLALAECFRRREYSVSSKK